MRISSASSWLAAVAMTAAFSVAGPALAQHETGANVPANAYPGSTLTPEERAGIAAEEDVTPNDGRPSVPPPQVKGFIPDAADQTPAAAPADPATPKSTTKVETESEVILNDAKKDDRVTGKDISECMRAWDPQTQMTKEEWAASCRTTLQYFPEKSGD
jgi:hypothetical protein